MNKKRHSRVGLTFIFAATIFMVMLATMAILFMVTWFLHTLGIIELANRRAPMLTIFMFAVASIVTGTVISVIISKIPLSPIRTIIAASDELAKGNFNVRIKFRGPEELQELAGSFNHMAEELGSIEMLRNDFINNFSHEFKTPIVSMRGFAKMLKYEDLTPAEHGEYLDVIINESDRLASLATNVLNLSRVENQTILTDKKEFNVTEQIRQVIVVLERRWTKKDLDIVFDCDEIMINGNQELLEQVWINLLDNAIKFSRSGGTIEISGKQLEEKVVFTFSDSGYGMDIDIVKHVFEKFYQGDTSHAIQGNGLGLNLAKKIVELHQGEIKITNTNLSGSTFEIILPRGR